MKQRIDFDAALYMDKLFKIYEEIDSAYEESANHYGFSCDGCEDNCCSTVFYHYTLVEYFAVLEGFDKLPDEVKDESMRRAREYLQELNKYRGKEEQVKMMCPLNYDGLCKIYEFRPLICRIHALPGFLDHPVKGKQDFGGCKRFEEVIHEKDSHLIDRTPFYTRIATLESQLRREMDYLTKFRKTITEMLIDRNL